MLRVVLWWLVLLVVAVGNGAMREMTFGRKLSELRAHQLSSLIGSALIGGMVGIFVLVWPPGSAAEAWRIGFIWVGLTVAFECFLGFVLLGRSAREVLTDYDLFSGRVWVLFLFWLAVAPWFFFRLGVGR